MLREEEETTTLAATAAAAEPLVRRKTWRGRIDVDWNPTFARRSGFIFEIVDRRPGPPSSVSTEPQEEKGIPLSQRTGSPSARSGFPDLLYPFPFFFPSTSQPPASSRIALPPHAGIPHFLYPPAFLTTPRFAPAAGTSAEQIKAAGPLLLKLDKLRVYFFYRQMQSTSISSIFRMLKSTWIELWWLRYMMVWCSYGSAV